MTLITLDPTYQPPAALKRRPSLADRPADLRGKTVGMLMNRLANCEVFFDALASEMCKLDDDVSVISVMKDSQSVAPNAEQWEQISAADVVVTGFGGCGSCSTRSMRDALDLEARGIPAVCVVHSALVPAVRIIAGLGELPDYPMVVVGYPHGPLAPWDQNEAAGVAKAIAQDVRRCLLSESLVIA